MPAIQDEQEVLQYDSKNKTEIFRSTFFPTSRPAVLDNIPGSVHPEPLTIPAISEKEVSNTIRRAPGRKAPGPDAIPNHILHKLADILTPQLTNIYNACLRLGYYPEQ